jgi:hypothetical protein
LISKAVKAGEAPCEAGCLYGLDDQHHNRNNVLASDSVHQKRVPDEPSTKQLLQLPSDMHDYRIERKWLPE